ncbi:hypothetical protein EMPS_00872 [Entomortierella parvispora]|uniref:Uncharacterized protein n=1 Tax=Entomortierella parvispora TaxID=205924 RepID=A0A9P3H1S7_9FUNG|nr:hypothetical protein EMPS_00872 [Entomortierella parvispora]
MSKDQQKQHHNDQWHPSLLPGSAASNAATDQATAWLKWLVHSTSAMATADCVINERLFSEPMVLGMPMILGTADCLSAPSSSSAQGYRYRSRRNAPGQVHFNQGTEEASRASASISSGATTAGPRAQRHPAGTKTAGYDTHEHSSHDADETSRPVPQDEMSNPAAARVLNRSTTLSSAKVASRNQDADRSSSSSSSSAPISSSPTSSSPSSSGTGSSSLLLSANQEFFEAWTRTTAFLHRTFSPTYRVGGLYIDSWTNGAQRRGLEKMKTSLLRGDAWVLVKGITAQLQTRWKQSIADSEAKVKDMERRAKSIEDVKRLSNRGGNNRKSGCENEGDGDNGSRTKSLDTKTSSGHSKD